MKKILFILIILVGLTFIGIVAFSPDKVDQTIEPLILPSQEGLPAIVEAKRQAIYQAAKEKDYDKLALQAETIFSYSFGGSEEGGFIANLKNKNDNQNGEMFDIITTLLELPYGEQGDYYVWPSVFTKESKDWMEADIAQMKVLLTDEEIEGYRQFGGYAYYRIGITEDGKWVYFIAGD